MTDRCSFSHASFRSARQSLYSRRQVSTVLANSRACDFEGYSRYWKARTLHASLRRDKPGVAIPIGIESSIFPHALIGGLQPMALATDWADVRRGVLATVDKPDGVVDLDVLVRAAIDAAPVMRTRYRAALEAGHSADCALAFGRGCQLSLLARCICGVRERIVGESIGLALELDAPLLTSAERAELVSSGAAWRVPPRGPVPANVPCGTLTPNPRPAILRRSDPLGSGRRTVAGPISYYSAAGVA